MVLCRNRGTHNPNPRQISTKINLGSLCKKYTTAKQMLITSYDTVIIMDHCNTQQIQIYRISRNHLNNILSNI